MAISSKRAAQLARVEAVQTALASADFQRRLNAALGAARAKNSGQEVVHALALRVLEGMGHDLSGVVPTLTWDPSRRRLDVLRVRAGR